MMRRTAPTAMAVGMSFALDGGATVADDFGTRVGDSVVITEDSFEYLTDFPRELTVLSVQHRAYREPVQYLCFQPEGDQIEWCAQAG